MAITTYRAYKYGTMSSATALNTMRSVSLGSLSESIPDNAVIYDVSASIHISTTSRVSTNSSPITISSGGFTLQFTPSMESGLETGMWINELHLFQKAMSAPDYDTIIKAENFTTFTAQDGGSTYLKPDSNYSSAVVYIYFNYYIPENPTPPTLISFDTQRPAPSTKVTAYMSGYTAGEVNEIVSFELLRSDSQNGTYTQVYSGVSPVCTVTPNQTYGASYWYKGRVTARDLDNKRLVSELSSAFQLQTMDRTAPTAPTTLTIDGKTAVSGVSTAAGVAGSAHILAWSGAQDGQGNPIGSYEIWRSTSENGTYTKLKDGITGTEYEVTAHTTMGSEYWYKIKTVGKDDASKISDFSTIKARLQTLQVTVPTAPTTVTIDNAENLSAKTGTEHVLRWSGAEAGTNNAITGYKILRSFSKSSGYESLTEVDASATSFTITAPTTDKESAYYKIQTIGTYSDSQNSTATASITAYALGVTSTPSNVRVSADCVGPETTVTLSWDKSTPGANAVISSYEVHRSTNPVTGYTLLATTEPSTASLSVLSHPAEGGAYYFKVRAVCTDHDADSAFSSYVALKTNQAPTQAVVQSGTVTHGQRPRIMVTLGEDPEGELMSIAASGYTASRSSGLESGAHVLLRKANAIERDGVNMAIISLTDPHEGTAETPFHVEYKAIQWTDPAVIAGTTTIRAAHITELQEAVDDMRAYYRMNPASWTECKVGETNTLLWYTHISEILRHIQEIAETVNAWDPETSVNNILLPSVEVTLRPTAETIMQLRNIITTL